jgi:peroxiredoxin family protein
MAETPPGLSLVVHSGDYPRVHYALAMAAAALAANQPVTLFFTMGAARALLAADDAGPGWRTLGSGEDGVSPLEADRILMAKGLGGFEEFLAATVALGASIMVCEMGLRACDLEGAVLRADVPITSGGLVTLLSAQSAGDRLLFI